MDWVDWTILVVKVVAVFFGLLVTFMPFGIIMTGLGVISLAGVVVNNAIVLISYIASLRARGMSVREAITTGGQARLRPLDRRRS